MTMDVAYAPTGSGADGRAVNSAIKYLIDVFKRRFLILSLITLSSVVIATIIAFMATPQFIATTRIKIDPAQNAAIGVDAPTSSSTSELQIETETNIIRSRDVAVMVTKKLDLINDPQYAAATAASAGGAIPTPAIRIDMIANALLSGLSVDRARSTYVIDISFKSTDAVRSALIANAFAQSYMDYSVGNRSGTANQKADFLRQRMQVAGAELAKTEGEVAQYKAQAGIIGGGANGSFGGTVTDQEAASLSGQLATAESQASAAQARLDVARQQMASGGLDTVSAVLSSTVIGDLRRQRAEVVREMGDIQTRYGPKHPETLKVTQQLQQIDVQLDQEARRVIGGLASEAAAESARVGTLRSQMAGLRGTQSAKVRAGTMAQSMEQQAAAQRNSYNQLATELQQASQLSRNTQTQAQIVEAAVAPQSPASPNKKLYILLGFLLGLGLGTSVIGAQELMSTGLRLSDDVESRLGIPFITSIPMVNAAMLDIGGQKVGPADLIIHKPVIPFGEAFRVARNTLRLGGGGRKVLTMVSSLPNEGKTTSVVSMARIMAQAGDRVLLIDGDIRKASLTAMTVGEREKGLIELLHGDATLDEVLVKDSVGGLDIIPLAKPLFTAEDVFGSDAMKALIETNRDRYDQILIDTPPLLGVADARTLASLSDAVVLLIRWGSTPLNSIRSGLTWLEMDRAPVAGAMFTMVDPRSEAIGAMYYSRKYSSYYQSA